MAAIDFERAARFIESVPEGRWTTFGDVAAAGGDEPGAQAVGQWLGRSGGAIPNFWRVLRADGFVPDGLRGGRVGRPHDAAEARQMLRREGVEIDNAGRAASRQRYRSARWAERGTKPALSSQPARPDAAQLIPGATRKPADDDRAHEAHFSHSGVQLAAERVILQTLSERLGRRLAPRVMALPGGARVQVDGAAEDDSILVEVFARQGALKGGQQKKVAQDALKLVTLGRTYPDARLVLAFADYDAAAYATAGTWVAEALTAWGIEVVVVEVDEFLRSEIRAAQTRQVMVNVTPSPTSTLDGLAVIAAGVDGCRSGWVAALAMIDDEQHPSTGLQFFSSVEDIVAWRQAQTDPLPVGIDIPIGLPDLAAARPCDRDARQRLGARWMSVFAVPDRELLGHDFETARAIVHARREADPTRDFSVMSQQSIAIMNRIAEVDHLMSQHPDTEDWLIEVHPEVSFSELAGKVLPAKSHDSGARTRLELLRHVFPDIDEQVEAVKWPKSKVGSDDIIDAYAVLWSTLRFSRGAGHYAQLGGGERDNNGVLMRMIV